MKANDEKYPKARYDFDTNPQVYGFKVGETYRFRDFGRGVEVFYNDGCSLAMGYNMFNECFTKIMETNESPEKIYIQPSAIEQLPHQNIVYTKPLADNSIEYTRTDVFIEKAINWINYNNENGGCLFDNWKKDFKKHMKGE